MSTGRRRNLAYGVFVAGIAIFSAVPDHAGVTLDQDNRSIHAEADAANGPFDEESKFVGTGFQRDRAVYFGS